LYELCDERLRKAVADGGDCVVGVEQPPARLRDAGCVRLGPAVSE